MITFSCTNKVLKRLEKYKIVENEKVEIGFNNWYVDQINLERKNYFIFIHSESLFSFFIYVGTKDELVNIEELFEKNAKEVISRELNVPSSLMEELIFPRDKKYKFVKTNSRSILGSISDFKNQIKVQIWHKGEISKIRDLIIQTMNKCPMSALKYEAPTKVLKEILETKNKEKYN